MSLIDYAKESISSIMPTAAEPRSLPRLVPVDRLGPVDACLNNVFPSQSATKRRKAAQLHKENPKRPCCSPRPAA